MTSSPPKIYAGLNAKQSAKYKKLHTMRDSLNPKQQKTYGKLRSTVQGNYVPTQHKQTKHQQQKAKYKSHMQNKGLYTPTGNKNSNNAKSWRNRNANIGANAKRPSRKYKKRGYDWAKGSSSKGTHIGSGSLDGWS